MKILAWLCDSCAQPEPAQEDYELGDSELCVLCDAGLAAVVELEPVCAHCPEQRPAACYGRYEAMEESAFACDTCCGHGCEDGCCEPLVEVENG